MLDLGTKSWKAGTVTVPLLLPKNEGYAWFTGFIFTVASSTCTFPKRNRLLTRFEKVAGTLTSRLVVTLVFRGFVVALIVGKLVVTLERSNIYKLGFRVGCVNNYSWVVRISFVSIFLYQVSFVRSDKGLDRVHRKTVGTSRDLARLFKRSQDFLGQPEEKVVSGEESIEIPRNNHVWRGKHWNPEE